MCGLPMTTSEKRRPAVRRSGALPNLVVIGAMKCGTTSLHMYLDQHPSIGMSRRKEISYFIEGHEDRGVGWYESHFDPRFPIRGESSPIYTKYPLYDGVPARMRQLLPDAKLIYIIRDPVERTVSHYLHEYLRGREERPLAEALRPLGGNPYVSPSRYHMQVERYLEHYPLSRILILATEDLRDHPQETLLRVVDFLGVAPFEFDVVREANVAEKRGRSNWLGRILESPSGKRIGRRLPRPAVEIAKFVNARLSTRVRRPILDAATRQELTAFLADDVARLRALTGMAFEKWSL
jgi:hypothetical protein